MGAARDDSLSSQGAGRGNFGAESPPAMMILMDKQVNELALFCSPALQEMIYVSGGLKNIGLKPGKTHWVWPIAHLVLWAPLK